MEGSEQAPGEGSVLNTIAGKDYGSDSDGSMSIVELSADEYSSQSRRLNTPKRADAPAITAATTNARSTPAQWRPQPSLGPATKSRRIPKHLVDYDERTVQGKSLDDVLEARLDPVNATPADLKANDVWLTTMFPRQNGDIVGCRTSPEGPMPDHLAKKESALKQHLKERGKVNGALYQRGRAHELPTSPNTLAYYILEDRNRGGKFLGATIGAKVYNVMDWMVTDMEDTLGRRGWSDLIPRNARKAPFPYHCVGGTSTCLAGYANADTFMEHLRDTSQERNRLHTYGLEQSLPPADEGRFGVAKGIGRLVNCIQRLRHYVLDALRANDKLKHPLQSKANQPHARRSCDTNNWTSQKRNNRAKPHDNFKMPLVKGNSPQGAARRFEHSKNWTTNNKPARRHSRADHAHETDLEVADASTTEGRDAAGTSSRNPSPAKQKSTTPASTPRKAPRAVHAPEQKDASSESSSTTSESESDSSSDSPSPLPHKHVRDRRSKRSRSTRDRDDRRKKPRRPRSRSRDRDRHQYGRRSKGGDTRSKGRSRSRSRSSSRRHRSHSRSRERYRSRHSRHRRRSYSRSASSSSDSHGLRSRRGRSRRTRSEPAAPRGNTGDANMAAAMATAVVTALMQAGKLAPVAQKPKRERTPEEKAAKAQARTARRQAQKKKKAAKSGLEGPLVAFDTKSLADTPQTANPKPPRAPTKRPIKVVKKGRRDG